MFLCLNRPPVPARFTPPLGPPTAWRGAPHSAAPLPRAGRARWVGTAGQAAWGTPLSAACTPAASPSTWAWAAPEVEEAMGPIGRTRCLPWAALEASRLAYPKGEDTEGTDKAVSFRDSFLHPFSKTMFPFLTKHLFCRIASCLHHSGIWGI